MKISVTHNKVADTLYLRFSNSKAKNSKRLDRNRVIDYSEDGEIKGIEFSLVSFGIKTDDLPHKSAIERALRENKINLVPQDFEISAESIRRNIDSITKKASLKGNISAIMWAILATIIFIISIAAEHLSGAESLRFDIAARFVVVPVRSCHHDDSHSNRMPVLAGSGGISPQETPFTSGARGSIIGRIYKNRPYGGVS